MMGGDVTELHFKTEGLEYSLNIDKSGYVWLDLLGGTTKKGCAWRNPCKDLFWDEPCFGDVDLGINMLRVFGVTQKLLLHHIHSKKPGRIAFSASTERKKPIYRWLAKRLAKQLGGYNLLEYPTGVFNFYRLANSLAGQSGG